MSAPGGSDDMEAEIRRMQAERRQRDGNLVGMGAVGGFDSDLYGGGAEYESSIAPMDVDEDEAPEPRLPSYTAPSHVRDLPVGDAQEDVFAETRRKTIAEREDEYHARRQRHQVLSPARADMFADETPAGNLRKPSDAVLETQLLREEADLRAKLAKKYEEEKRKKVEAEEAARKERDSKGDRSKEKPKERERPREREHDRDRRDRDRDRDRERDRDRDRNRDRDRDREGRKTKRSEWEKQDVKEEKVVPTTAAQSKWDVTDTSAPTQSRWDATPSATPSASRWDATPVGDTPRKRSRWDATPASATPGGSRWDMTPASRTPSRWDATPSAAAPSATPKKEGSRWDETPAVSAGMVTPAVGVTPFGGLGLATPTPSQLPPMTPEQIVHQRLQAEIDYRNRPLTDEELDEMLPEGYKVVKPPANYAPIRTPARKLTATPTPLVSGFMMQGEGAGPDRTAYGAYGTIGTGPMDLPEIKPEDRQYFEKLLDGRDETQLSPEEAKEVKIMKLLLKVKNGTPPQRKQALRQITDKARDFGPGALFDHILPLLMSPTLEDQERHLLVKVIDRVLYKLDDLVRPYVHKILVVIEPLLIEEDYYARVEGREIISNLAKAAGLATMIAVMRPDIDNADEYVRNTTARAFAVVASALGIPSLLPFLRAVCQSKASWQARHTGIKIVQQISLLLGCAVLPHLKGLVSIIENGLRDQEQKVRTITALAIAALAEAAAPYGIESFDSVLKPLWYGINEHRGKGLAAFLKAIGYIIPLMDAEYASYYTIEVMRVLVREFASPEDEMKKIVLKVVKQCVATEGVQARYVREEILPPFFRHFWVARMAMDRRNYRALVETTVALAHKVGTGEIVTRIVEHLKSESEPYRRMVCETVDEVITEVGAAEIDARLEELLIDGVLYAFREQMSDDAAPVLNAFGTIVNAMGKRVKPYLPQMVQVIRWRLTSKLPKVRQQAADLIGKVAMVMRTCEEEPLLGQLGVDLYESLSEEYPEVLGSILGGLKAIVNVIGMTKMTPPIKDLLPRLTPILKNRHEKVQENCIDLVGRIADRGRDFVQAREWMRICFELLEMLKAHKKGIRRATVNTFGYIARAIGPHDVLGTLLNNLRVQERQNRVCTTVAIAIVAETCEPYTVLPALLNEYRVPELNVQNGVLKALSFMFEYISEMGKDYVYAVVPLLQDALMDRDVVHRQTTMTVCAHIGLGVAALGCEDAIAHLLNFVWPNVFEVSPHVHNAFLFAVEGARMALGVAWILNYLWQGLFHAARKVRSVYWKVYNNCYIGSEDAMVAAYPTLPDEEGNLYTRAELNMFV